MSEDLARRVVEAIHGGDLDCARRLCATANKSKPENVKGFFRKLGRAVHVPKGTVLHGSGVAIWGNPYRDDYAWRCGGCPWTGSFYKTPQRARKAAIKHAAEHSPGLPVQEATVGTRRSSPIGA